jgi:hypothetical protein
MCAGGPCAIGALHPGEPNTAIGRAASLAVELLGPAFIRSPEVSYLLAATHVLCLHPPARLGARTALPAEAVVKAVVHAMTARRPKTRYLVGRDTWLWILLNLLPDRWRDRLILSKTHE